MQIKKWNFKFEVFFFGKMLNFIPILIFLTEYKDTKENRKTQNYKQSWATRETCEINKQWTPQSKLRGSWMTKHQFWALNSDICKVVADPKNWSPHHCCHELLLPRPALKPRKWEEPTTSPRTMQKRTNFRRQSYTRRHRSFYGQS